MRQAGKQIAICALILFLFCLLFRFTVFRTYTAHIPIRIQTDGATGDIPKLTLVMERPGIAHLGNETWSNNGVLNVPVYPDHPGNTEVVILDENGEELGIHLFRVGPMKTVFDLQTGGFTGDSSVLIMVTLFWFSVSAIMLWHYLHAKGPAFYAYSTIYYAGFSIFAFVTGILLLQVTVSHLIRPMEYSMLSAFNAINGASKRFMMVTFPAMVVFSVAMAISNLKLLRHERLHLQNILGLATSFILIICEAIGVYLFTRDFMGSEWEGRIRNSLENVFATIFVYFECMLIGSVICGIKAARYHPSLDKDFIIILGCWFRRDGTLPPLLKGRVDCAISFWKAQKEHTGKEAVFIPSGGQGPDETMPEAKAMQRYLEGKGIPAHLIHPESSSSNTYQNMEYSKRIADSIKQQGEIIFATTNYHVFRSGVWANQAGLSAEGIGGKTNWWFWPNAFMRECAGLLLKRWKQGLLFLFLLIVFFGVLSMILG